METEDCPHIYRKMAFDGSGFGQFWAAKDRDSMAWHIRMRNGSSFVLRVEVDLNYETISPYVS